MSGGGFRHHRVHKSPNRVRRTSQRNCRAAVGRRLSVTQRPLGDHHSVCAVRCDDVSSNGVDGVFAINDSSTDTPPNIVCPIGVPFGPSNYTGPTTITLGQSTDDIWVTLPPSYDPIVVTAYGSSGNALVSESSSGPNSTGSATGRRVHVEANNITSVVIDSATSGGRYCFDTFTWQELWY
jgi:hypothetical protein